MRVSNIPVRRLLLNKRKLLAGSNPTFYGGV
jgi:hypothetical protein